MKQKRTLIALMAGVIAFSGCNSIHYSPIFIGKIGTEQVELKEGTSNWFPFSDVQYLIVTGVNEKKVTYIEDKSESKQGKTLRTYCDDKKDIITLDTVIIGKEVYTPNSLVDSKFKLFQAEYDGYIKKINDELFSHMSFF